MRTVFLFGVGFTAGWYWRVILRAWRRYWVNRAEPPVDRVRIKL